MLPPLGFGVLDLGIQQECLLPTSIFDNLYIHFRPAHKSSCVGPSETQLLLKSVSVGFHWDDMKGRNIGNSDVCK